jgi:hypothetical protein
MQSLLKIIVPEKFFRIVFNMVSAIGVPMAMISGRGMLDFFGKPVTGLKSNEEVNSKIMFYCSAALSL